MLPFTVNLQGKVAVVTGGTGVLCSAMARALAQCGAKVAIVSRRAANVEQEAAAIRAAGGVAIGVSGDVTDKASLEKARATIEAELGPCDILINGAGGNHPKGTAGREVLAADGLKTPSPPTTFFDLEAEGFKFVFDLNYVGTVLPCQVFGRGMVERNRGCIINVSSMSAFKPLTKVMSYSSAKAAVNNFTQWLAVHLARTGVRVNAIAPGFFKTEQNRALLENADGSNTPRAATIVAHTPMQRFGQAQDLVGCLLWLVSDEAAGFVTGAVIPVDGGFHAFSGV
jgi:NAD(P)-dependent dehydrogenase (short-subunit alcohol dehydrogenase family)